MKDDTKEFLVCSAVTLAGLTLMVWGTNETTTFSAEALNPGDPSTQRHVHEYLTSATQSTQNNPEDSTMGGVIGGVFLAASISSGGGAATYIIIKCKNETPYRPVERRASQIYRGLHRGSATKLKMPVLVATTKRCMEDATRLFGNNDTGEMMESLSVLEELLEERKIN